VFLLWLILSLRHGRLDDSDGGILRHLVTATRRVLEVVQVRLITEGPINLEKLDDLQREVSPLLAVGLPHHPLGVDGEDVGLVAVIEEVVAALLQNPLHVLHEVHLGDQLPPGLLVGGRSVLRQR